MPKVADFNGLTKNYEVILNKYIVFDTTITAGAVKSLVDFDFYNTAGNLVCSAKLQIDVKFTAQENGTVLKLSTIGSQQASFLEQYFLDNGIRLYINEKGAKT